MKQPRKSPPKPLPPSETQIDEAQRNLEAALEAYDREGEKGLQSVLDRIYPGTSLQTEDFMTASHAVLMPELPRTRVYDPEKDKV